MKTEIQKWKKLLNQRQLAKVGWAGVIGISVGVFAAILNVHRPAYAAQAPPPPFILPVRNDSSAFSVSRDQAGMKDALVDPELVEHLKTRNRRLEALVTVLRRRAAERHE